MTSKDHKRFIDRQANRAFAELMAKRFDAGEIVPFAVLFPETECEWVTGDNKGGKEMVQISFLVTNSAGEVLVVHRAKFQDHGAGHETTTDQSVLISRSPVRNGPPQREKDVEDIYRSEVVDDDDNESTPDFRFIGLVQRDVAATRYYCYVFHVHYAEPSPQFRPFRKESGDRTVAFNPIDADLLARLADKAVDLIALKMLEGGGVGPIEINGARGIPHRAAALQPFEVKQPCGFISHATLDDGLADRLIGDLSSLGYPTWIDHRDIRGADEWFREVRSAIKYGRDFILLCSNSSFQSDHVKEEIALALETRALIERQNCQQIYNIVGIVLEGEPKTQFVPDKIRKRFHLLDFRAAEKWQKGVADVANILAR